MDITVKPIGQILEDHHMELLKQSQSHLQFIDQIKAEVGQDVDVEHPEPLFSQL